MFRFNKSSSGAPILRCTVSKTSKSESLCSCLYHRQKQWLCNLSNSLSNMVTNSAETWESEVNQNMVVIPLKLCS